MLWQIELLYFILMIGTFVLLLLCFKVPAGLSLMAAAIIGALASALISRTDLSIRHFVEGGFGYFDTIIVVTTSMIFMVSLDRIGALDYFSAFLLKNFYKAPSLLLISFMFILMFPGMITGSSLSSVVCSGALVAPIMIKMGIPKAKTGAIVAFGAVFGMIAPPINIPVMVICDVVDIPYIGFVWPLLVLVIPLAIFTVLFLGLKHVKKINLEAMKEVINFDILKEFKWTVSLPIIVLVALIIAQGVFPKIFGSLGMPLIFVIATIITFLIGKKVNVLRTIKDGVARSFPAIALLIGVGMFVQIISLNGVRGYFVINALSLPSFWQYLSMALATPIFGGISAFGSASIFGGPYVMALISLNEIVVASSLSLLAGLGEFLPPTAMSATFASKIVNEKNYFSITKEALVPLLVCLGYAMFFIIVIARIW